MGRVPCCEKVGLKKGPWTPEEDKNLVAYVEKHGHGKWSSVPAKADVERVADLRWINYLNPDIKRGNFSLAEDHTIIQLHALLGNKWSIIASHLPKRTDNEIKNYSNTNIKKRLIRMGTDPVTHKPKAETYGGDQFKDAINKNHMAQRESVRLKTEARESMLQAGSSSVLHPQLIIRKIPIQPYCSPYSLSTKHNNPVCNAYALMLLTDCDLKLPVPTVSLSSKQFPVSTNVGQFADTLSSLSYKGDGNNVIKNYSQIQKITEGYGPNFQDDDVMVTVEAFRTARCESIPELFNDFTAIEGNHSS